MIKRSEFFFITHHLLFWTFICHCLFQKQSSQILGGGLMGVKTNRKTLIRKIEINGACSHLNKGDQVNRGFICSTCPAL